MSEHVAVLVVAYRSASEIRRCLEALADSTHPDFEVQVCENGGPEAYEVLLRELGESPVVSSLESVPARAERVVASHRGTLRPGGQSVGVHLAVDNLGYAGGINTAQDEILEPAWSAIWVLNPDAEADPDALVNLTAHADKGYGIVGSRLLLAETGRVQLYGGRWRKWIGRGFNIGLDAPADSTPDTGAIEAAMDYVSGAAMYVTRRFIETVGRMDEKYFLYMEEVDWCFRRGAFRLGYAHDAIVYHQHGATTGASHDRKKQSPLSVYLEERNKIVLTKRFFPRGHPVVLLTTFMLTGQYLLAGAFRNFGYAVRGWFAGCMGRTGPPKLGLPLPPRRVTTATTPT